MVYFRDLIPSQALVLQSELDELNFDVKRKIEMETTIPDDHLSEIGRITANFAILESTLCRFIGALLEIDAVAGKIVTAELSFRNMVNLLDSLFKYRCADSQLVGELEKLLGGVMQVEQRRNQITHSTWGLHPETGNIARLKRTAKKGSGLQQQEEIMTSQDLWSIAVDINTADNRLNDFMKNYFQ